MGIYSSFNSLGEINFKPPPIYGEVIFTAIGDYVFSIVGEKDFYIIYPVLTSLVLSAILFFLYSIFDINSLSF